MHGVILAIGIVPEYDSVIEDIDWKYKTAFQFPEEGLSAWRDNGFRARTLEKLTADLDKAINEGGGL